MAESKVKRENFVTIQGWMVSDLNLKGNELLIYAIIYGFSQDGDTHFTGTLQYLADWTNSTKQGVLTCLKSLVKKGLIVKTDRVVNNVKLCEYHATKLNGVLNKVERGVLNKVERGIKQSLINNIEDNIDEKNIEDKEERKSASRAGGSFDTLIAEFSKGDQEVKELLQEWLKVRKAKRAAMTDKAIELNLRKLEGLAAKSGMTVAAYLQEVICRGWQAFYPINNGAAQSARRETSGNVFLDMARDENIF